MCSEEETFLTKRQDKSPLLSFVFDSLYRNSLYAIFVQDAFLAYPSVQSNSVFTIPRPNLIKVLGTYLGA
jgi:hypothetical protein